MSNFNDFGQSQLLPTHQRKSEVGKTAGKLSSVHNHSLHSEHGHPFSLPVSWELGVNVVLEEGA